MSLTISKMTENDIESVFKIENELLKTSSIETVKNTLSNEKLNYYVLKNEEDVIGFVEFLLIPPECELYDIAIKTEFQGNGFSKLLMEKLIEISKENICETIFLEVNSINYRAINLYEKFGFVAYSKRKNYYGENDAILMKLDI